MLFCSTTVPMDEHKRTLKRLRMFHRLLVFIVIHIHTKDTLLPFNCYQTEINIQGGVWVDVKDKPFSSHHILSYSKFLEYRIKITHVIKTLMCNHQLNLCLSKHKLDQVYSFVGLLYFKILNIFTQVEN